MRGLRPRLPVRGGPGGPPEGVARDPLPVAAVRAPAVEASPRTVTRPPGRTWALTPLDERARGDGPPKEGARCEYGGSTMTRTCPDCGSPVDYASRTEVVLEGACAGCGHTITVLQHPGAGGPPGTGVRIDGPTEREEGVAPVEATGWAGPRPACEGCGAPLTFRVAGVGVQGFCSSCGLTSEFHPERVPAREPRSRRPPRFEPAAEGRGGYGPTRTARPCRECGGPLRFSTAPDGTISGECDQCGNRFTLPPRRDSPPGRREGDRRFDRGTASRFGRRGPPRRYGRAPGAGYRPREGRRDRDGDEDDRPRRRPRRE